MAARYLGIYIYRSVGGPDTVVAYFVEGGGVDIFMRVHVHPSSGGIDNSLVTSVKSGDNHVFWAVSL